MNLCLIDMEYQGVEAVFWFMWKKWEVQKKEHLEYAWILNFLDVIQMCLHFCDIFSRKVDFLMRILKFESPHFIEYKNRYDFLKFVVLLKPLFQQRCGNWLQTLEFCSWCLSWIFLPYIRCVCGISPSGIMLKSSPNN